LEGSQFLIVERINISAGTDSESSDASQMLPDYFKPIVKNDELKSDIQSDDDLRLDDDEKLDEDENILRQKSKLMERNNKIINGIPRGEILLNESLFQDSILTAGNGKTKFRNRLTGYLRMDDELSLHRFFVKSPFKKKFGKSEVLSKSPGGANIIEAYELVKEKLQLDQKRSSNDNSPFVRKLKRKKIECNDGDAVANLHTPYSNLVIVDENKIDNDKLVNKDLSTEFETVADVSLFFGADRMEKIYLDSGTTVSTENELKLLYDVRKDNTGRMLAGAINDSDKLVLEHSGNRSLSNYLEKDVYYHERLTRLSAVGGYTDDKTKSMIVLFDKNKATIYELPNGTTINQLHDDLKSKFGLKNILEFARDGKLWSRTNDASAIYDEEEFSANVSTMEKLTDEQLGLIYREHVARGHVSYQSLKELIRLHPNETIFNKLRFNWNPKVIDELVSCKACFTAKSRRISSKTYANRKPAEYPLEYLFIDTSGTVHFKFDLIKDKIIREALVKII
jgi:hypothetical protein